MEELEELPKSNSREKVHMIEQPDAHANRLAQMQKLLDLFLAAHSGRPARTVEELEEWVGSPEGQQATRFKKSCSLCYEAR